MQPPAPTVPPAADPAGGARPEISPAKGDLGSYRAIFDEALDAHLVIAAVTGHVLEVNRAVFRLLGYHPGELIGRDAMVVFPDHAGHTRPEWLFKLRVYGAVFEAQEFRRADGRSVWLDVTVTTILWNGERTVLATLRDIAERRQAEEQRVVLERRSLEAQKLEGLGVLAGGVAHEFNNLLTAMLGNAALAKMDSFAGGPVFQALTLIEQSAQQASLLCQQMLAYAGRGPFALQPVNLNSLIEEMSQLVRVSAGRESSLELDLAPHLPLVLADLSQLRQAVINLVTNAAESLSPGNGCIRIVTGVMVADRNYLNQTISPLDLAPGEYVYVEITDNGMGIAPELHARIFEPFYSTKSIGRGLGLAATLGIVRRHRGALRLESVPGRGTSVRVLLPGPATREPARPAEARPVEARFERPARIGAGTVLVVDDEEMIRRAVARMLESFGMTALFAGDGVEAVTVFEQQVGRIDLVLLDAGLPRRSGTEVFYEMRRIRPDVPVILMSGYTESEVTQNLPPDSLDGFVPKPFTPEILREAIASVLRARSRLPRPPFGSAA